MQHWYVQDKYNLIKGGDYSITRSYIDVIWNAVNQKIDLSYGQLSKIDR